jgi:hypothetical protein
MRRIPGEPTRAKISLHRASFDMFTLLLLCSNLGIFF